MMIRKTYRVFGEQGHRQRESFHRSYIHNFSCAEDGVRILDVRNADITGTNEYTEIAIIRNTEAECDRELEGQLSDGIFENSNTGIVKVVGVETLDDEAKIIRLRFAMPTWRSAVRQAMRSTQKVRYGMNISTPMVLCIMENKEGRVVCERQ